MTHHSDARMIESELERDRARLSKTLEELNERVSVDNLAREALGMIKTNAAVYTSSLDRAVRSNPLALTVAGIGLAWLIFGGRKNPSEPSAAVVNRWEDEGGSAMPIHGVAADHGMDPTKEWSVKLDALRTTASHALRRLEQDARSYADDVRDYAADRAQIIASFTDDMRATLRDGLDSLSETARERVVKAREAAYSAHLRTAQTVRTGGREAERLINEHPMIAGAVALALGAAFAAALPRTRAEDRAFGEESDHLMERAATLLKEERDRMTRVAEGVADELKSSAQKAARSAAATAAEIGESVRERAVAEAGETPSKT
ncbi:DUF3618 domain-containing protein [Defluviimonas aestuarii]|uniref:DUF3618 domain-containing protein n=1 Tax=Albidovulum aestuarii TaxID=1130726 RepID=UPI00249C7C31|nr:DUF3618 domain-containing protein [Defluviimonas aestuarii]MDI3335558.1 DUF3618 domain-containing protein [Defluviimonas aestuarii]